MRECPQCGYKIRPLIHHETAIPSQVKSKMNRTVATKPSMRRVITPQGKGVIVRIERKDDGFILVVRIGKKHQKYKFGEVSYLYTGRKEA